MAKVIPFEMFTTLDIPVENVLESALDNDLKNVLVLAYDENGEEYFASSTSDGKILLWLLERCKQRLMGRE